MVKGNHAVPNGHFHKHWNPGASQKGHVKVVFSQPAQKKQRRLKRAQKALKIFPRPVAGPLRPIVMCQTQRYNMKPRLGRGFTLEECKVAGLAPKYARTIGIAVDHRRTNHCEESLTRNVQRLKEYLSRLILYPVKAGKPKVGDSSAEVLATVKQDTGKTLAGVPRVHDVVLVKHAAPRPLKAVEKTRRIFQFLRKNRRDEHLIGTRIKRSDRKAEKAKQLAAVKK